MSAKRNVLTWNLMFVLIFLSLLGIGSQVFADRQESNEQTDFFEMSLEQLAEEPYVVKVTTASKRSEKIQDAPAILTVITAEEIKQFGAKNLLGVLERAPGIYTTGSYMYRQNVVSIRGITTTHHNKHTLLLLNGRPLRESAEGGADFPFLLAFPLEAIDKIEIIRGPGSVLYGSNAYSGVVNVVTKKPKETELQISSDYGSFDTKSSSLVGGTTIKDWQIYGGIRELDSGGWNFNATGESASQVTGDYSEHHVGTTLFLKNKNFTVNLFYADSEQAVMGALPTSPIGPYVYRKLFLDLGYIHEICDSWDIAINGTYNMRRSEFPFPTGSQVTADTDSDDYLLEITSHMQPSEKLNFVVGGSINHQTGHVTWYSPTPGQDPQMVPPYTNLWLNGYLQADYKVSESIKLIGGIQANKIETQSVALVPRVGIVANFTEKSGLKFFYGEAFRAPYSIETSINAPFNALQGEPGLEPEKISTFDLQLFHNEKKYQVALTGFYSKMDNMITRVTGTPPTYANQGKLHIYGAEFEGKYKPSANLQLIGSVSYYNNQDENGVINVTHIPNFMMKTGIFYKPSPVVSMGIFNSFYSKPSDVSKVNSARSVVNPNPKAYSWLSANITMDISKWLKLKKTSVELNLFVDNLLDEDVYLPEFSRRNINSIPAKGGRFIGGGLRIKF